MFVRLNLGESLSEKYRRSIYFAFTSFGIAIFANLVWMAGTPSGFSYGQSGVVYGFIGTILALFSEKSWAQIKINGSSLSKKNLLSLLVGISPFLFAILVFVTPMKVYMFEGSDLNSTVHEISFAMSFVLTLSYYHIRRTRPRYNFKTSLTLPWVILKPIFSKKSDIKLFEILCQIPNNELRYKES